MKYNRLNLQKNIEKYVHLTICTNNFTIKDCEVLIAKFNVIGLPFKIYKNNRQNNPVFTAKSSTIHNFFDYIGECTIPCFSYKWKLPMIN